MQGGDETAPVRRNVQKDGLATHHDSPNASPSPVSGGPRSVAVSHPSPAQDDYGAPTRSMVSRAHRHTGRLLLPAYGKAWSSQQ
jgi:hypothetical protein